MRKARHLGVILGALVVIIAAALLSIWLLVDPNTFKDRIAAAVKESTGRELKLEGDIKLSVFPWIALELGPASLGNPPGWTAPGWTAPGWTAPGSGEQPFLSFTKAAVRVKLLPLLQKRLEIARVDVEGLNLMLARNPAGRGNWQSPAAAPAPAQSEAPRHSSGLRIESLSNIQIHAGRIRYQDTVIEHLELQSGSVGAGGDVPINLSFDAKQGTPSTDAIVAAQFNLRLETDGSMRIAAVNVSGTLNRPGDQRPAHWDLSVPALAVDLDQQTLSAPAFTSSYSAVHVSGALHVTQLLGDPKAQGSVSLEPLLLHEFAPRLKITLPRTLDPKAWSVLSGDFAFNYDADGIALDHVALKLDDTNVTGELKVSRGETPAVKFELALDQIDLDRYRAADRAPPAPAPAAQAATPSEKQKLVDVDGTLTAGAMHAAGMDLTHLRVIVASHEGLTHLSPITASLYGGLFAGDVSLDQRGAEPTWNLDEHLTGVDLVRLLAHSGAKGHASGRANVTMKLKARGMSSDQLLNSLEGQVDANVTEGALEGVDVNYELGKAQQLLDRPSAASTVDTHRTPFDDFKLSADIADGIATTHNLTIVSPAFKIVGDGSVNLPAQGLNLNLTASLLKSPTTTLVDVPFKIAGRYSDPSVRVDLGTLAKTQLKQKLKDVLKKNGLEGLFK
jgi:AsmA protein